jgi:hypothetical protein
MNTRTFSFYGEEANAIISVLEEKDRKISGLEQQLATKDALLNTARELISRYRFEVPPGRQPHMICLESEDCIAAIDKELGK